ncbi:unnamed protein product [Strongylus vulgaris]|uniref:Uncharacterized protein n=1 Tax=Strongylus vulgaris TaxID=40348 RepID=A0A3P7JMB9_STRVU|nr:unnamed protein product [Strongylus vulgaris]
MIRARESPPKGLVEKRRAQFTQVEHSTSADETLRAPRSRSVPISAVLLNAQRPQSRPTRDEVHECGEATTTMERLSDGDSRMVRVIREIGRERGRHLTQPLSNAAVRAASHSLSRGFPIVTVNVTDPKSSRRRTVSDIPQPVIIEVSRTT